MLYTSIYICITLIVVYITYIISDLQLTIFTNLYVHLHILYIHIIYMYIHTYMHARTHTHTYHSIVHIHIHIMQYMLYMHINMYTHTITRQYKNRFIRKKITYSVCDKDQQRTDRVLEFVVKFLL